MIVPQPGAVPDPNYTGAGCAACADQQAGSPFMQKLNSIGDTVAGPSYTVISTVNDEVVIPYNSQFLNGPARQVTKTSSISGAWFRSRSAKNACWPRMSQRCVQPPVDLRPYGGRLDAL